MNDLTVVVPYYNGDSRITERLLEHLGGLEIPTILVDDLSDRKIGDAHGATVLHLDNKGYFSGAVNAGIRACDTDVLVLNQDVKLEGTAWLDLIAQEREEHALIGERIRGEHPAWPHGYIKGTFMFMRRDAIEKIGMLDEKWYPHWGSTADWNARIHRRGFRSKALRRIPGYTHVQNGQFGDSTIEFLKKRPDLHTKLVRTPPLISVIIPCFNHGHYLESAINSLIGGPTDLGEMPGQTFQGFEVIIVDDQSTDDSAKIAERLADDRKGIRFVQRLVNGGTPAANNDGIRASYGKYVTIMCADDMMESERLEKLLAVIEKNQRSVVCDELKEFRNGERIDHVLPDGKITPHMKMREYDFNQLIHRNQMHCGILFQRDAWRVVGGYPELMRYGREDWAMNVALGANGYCGLNVREPLYLYRRENQNRTLENTTPDWHQFFLGQLRQLFPRIYAGERPDMCCGNNAPPKAEIQTRPMAVVQGVDGMTLIEYVGTSMGTQSWYGPVSGKRYEFGLTKKKIQNVEPVDLRTGIMGKPGFLEIREFGKQIFVAAKIADPEAVPSAAEEVAFGKPSPEPEDEILDKPLEVIETEGSPESEKEWDEILDLEASKAAEKLLNENDISLNNLYTAGIMGSGKDGKYTVTDVRKYIAIGE